MTPDPWSEWPAEPGPFVALGGFVIWYALSATVFRARLIASGGPVPLWTGPGMSGPERRGEFTPWHVLRFFTGVITAGLALGSPLHSVGEAFLLTAHMAQHLIVTLAVPPLLITGIPAWMIRPILTWSPIAPVIKFLLSPVPAFMIFNSVFLGWHVPAFYELALGVPVVHALEHGTMILTAALTWWPVFGTLWEYPRLPYGGQVMYLFLQSLPPTVLGALMSLTSTVLYPTYELAPRIASWTAIQDQTVAGLVMWLPGALGYFVVLSGVFYVWVEKRAASGGEAPFRNPDPSRARREGRQPRSGVQSTRQAR